MCLGLFLAYWPRFSPEEQIALARHADRAGLDSATTLLAMPFGDRPAIVDQLAADSRRMSSVLVTGGLGFIGSRLCESLLDEGIGVRCVDDLSGAYAQGTGPAAAPALEARGAEVRIAGADPALLRCIDAVIHLAGLPGVRTRRTPAALHEANVLLTERLVRAASAHGVRFVRVSAQSLRAQQGGCRGGRSRARLGCRDRAPLLGVRAGATPGDGVRALDRLPRGRPAAAVACAARHAA